MGRVNESQRIRADARDRGLRRASTVTTWTAVGGAAATALAAFVLAQSPAGAQTSDAAADTIPTAPTLGSQDSPGDVSPGQSVNPDTAAPTTSIPAPRRSHTTHHSSSGSAGQSPSGQGASGQGASGQGLQPPAAPVAPVSPPTVRSYSHATSGSS